MPRLPIDHRLYALLDVPEKPGPAHAPALLAARAAAAIAGGVTLLQLRDKSGDTRASIARAAAVLAVRGAVPLLINDRVDIALATGADGVHLGRQDMPPAIARRLLGPEALIGVTIKAEEDLAALDAAMIDYGTIGGVFPTRSKDNADAPVGLAGLARLRAAARARAPLPIGAIAGIDAENAAAVIGAGADGVAVIGAIFAAANSADEITAAARTLRRIVDGALAARGLEGAPA